MNPVLRYSHNSNLFGLMRARDIAKEAKRAGWKWDERGFFTTPSLYKAMPFARIADDTARMVLDPHLSQVEQSRATSSALSIPAPAGCEYLPFQKAGIAYAVQRRSTLLGDEPGLGKTIQAIGVANYLGLKRILVICPANLRLNWAEEIEKWHLQNPGLSVVMNGKTAISPRRSCIISYDLAASRVSIPGPYDLVIADEGHYLKNPGARRTKAVLGFRGSQGLLRWGKYRLVLTGTPVPNRVNEIYPVIKTLAPEVIDRMSYDAFLRYYAVVVAGEYGIQVVGIRHEEELYNRLRAGFMVRRLKSEVLKDLPPKTYKMVVFSKDGFNKILERERHFNAQEIIRHGVPVGSALPEVRREMGVAKAPMVVSYVSDLLDSGVKQVIVFAHHREVASILERGLKSYGVVTVTGSTSAIAKQANKNTFQKGGARVFIGNIIAAGVGITLTAAADVVFAESSWVPGENEQAEDRAHRIGQGQPVLIHYLVVEESLDAVILGSAAKKRTNITRILDGGKDE